MDNALNKMFCGTRSRAGKVLAVLLAVALSLMAWNATAVVAFADNGTSASAETVSKDTAKENTPSDSQSKTTGEASESDGGNAPADSQAKASGEVGEPGDGNAPADSQSKMTGSTAGSDEQKAPADAQAKTAGNKAAADGEDAAGASQTKMGAGAEGSDDGDGQDGPDAEEGDNAGDTGKKTVLAGSNAGSNAPTQPQQPNIEGMTTAEANAAIAAYNEEVDAYNAYAEQENDACQQQYEQDVAAADEHNAAEDAKVTQNQAELDAQAKREALAAKHESNTSVMAENRTSDPDELPTDWSGELSSDPHTITVEKAADVVDEVLDAITYRIINIHLYLDEENDGTYWGTDIKDEFVPADEYWSSYTVEQSFDISEHFKDHLVLAEWEIAEATGSDTVSLTSEHKVVGYKTEAFYRYLPGYYNGFWVGTHELDSIDHATDYSWDEYGAQTVSATYDHSTYADNVINLFSLWVYTFYRMGAEPETVEEYTPDYMDAPETPVLLELLGHMALLDDDPTPQDPDDPAPGSGDDPTPQDPDDPTPGSGDDPTPQDPDDPTPGSGDDPTPQDPDDPIPGSGDAPTPQDPVTPIPGATDDPTPQDPDTPTPGAPDDPTPEIPENPVTPAPAEPTPQLPEKPAIPSSDDPAVPVTPEAVAPQSIIPVSAAGSPAYVTSAVAATTPSASPQPAAPSANAPQAPSGTSEIIEDDDVALASGLQGFWSLFDLLCTVAAVVLSVLMLLGLFGRNRKDAEEDSSCTAEDAEDERIKRRRILRVLSLVPAVGALVLLFLTQDFTLPMEIFDAWSLAFAVIALVSVVLLVASRKRTEDGDPDGPQQGYAGAAA